MPPSTPTHGHAKASAWPATLRQRLAAGVEAAVHAVLGDAAPASLNLRDAGLCMPKLASHGDYTTPLALTLARSHQQAPRALAERLAEAWRAGHGHLAEVSVAGPGHLNFVVRDTLYTDAVWRAACHGDEVLRSDSGDASRILLEFVSANPTGPLHVAHGRGAVHGDVVARLLATAGYDVTREYYVNDLGNQTDVLARSVHAHLRAMAGGPFVAPEEYYPGAYVELLARAMHDEGLGVDVNGPEEQWLPPIRLRATEYMLRRIKADLAAFNVGFDLFVSERAVAQPEVLQRVVERLRARETVFEQEGKIWFRSTDFGDDKDRVLVREDGRPTYFLSDVAYHDDKLQRGFANLVNVWGADHGGYLARVRAGLTALGHDPGCLQVDFVQMVSLVQAGQSVKMGKRLGTAVWLDEVIAQAGRDATRYLFLLRRLDAQMEFDIDLAMRRSLDNPVYYAQMGHARLCAIARRAAEAGFALPEGLALANTPALQELLGRLTLPEERALMHLMVRAPEVIADAARAREPHQVASYLQSLIASFHSYYGKTRHDDRIIGSDADKTRARLLLCRALQGIMKGLLTLLGVDAPEQMHLDKADSDKDEDQGEAPTPTPTQR